MLVQDSEKSLPDGPRRRRFTLTKYILVVLGCYAPARRSPRKDVGSGRVSVSRSRVWVFASEGATEVEGGVSRGDHDLCPRPLGLPWCKCRPNGETTGMAKRWRLIRTLSKRRDADGLGFDFLEKKGQRRSLLALDFHLDQKFCGWTLCWDNVLRGLHLGF
jgi:hypothetical protein